MSTPIATTQSVQGVPRQCKTPKSVGLPLNFASSSAFQFDLKPLQNTGGFDSVLTLYIDNSGNAAPLLVVVQGINFTIACPSNSQGYFPVCAPDPPTLSFSCSGGQAANVFLLNYHVAPAVWKVV